MKKLLSLLLLSFWCFLGSASGIQAQSALPGSNDILPQIASLSASEAATLSAEIATTSPSVEQKIQEKKDSNITESSPVQKGKLAMFLDQNPIGPLSWNNFLAYAIRSAVNAGVPANVLVIVVLFPFIASFIAASRHIIGLRGFGIYIPAVLSVALVSTGPILGIAIFGGIITVALLTKKLLKHTELPYLPRTALMLWTISIAVLAMMLVAPVFNLTTLMSLNIFPILILVLLSENFLDAQANSKPSDAFALAVETLGLALVSSFFLSWEALQKFALLQPELVLLSSAALNFIVGRFVGLRLTEWLRFRPIIEE